MAIGQTLKQKVAQSRFSKPLLWLYILFKTRSLPAHPSQEEKYGLIISYAKRNNLKLMVETGTFKGDSIMAVRNIFESRFGVNRIRAGNEFTSVARGLALSGAQLAGAQ